MTTNNNKKQKLNDQKQESKLTKKDAIVDFNIENSNVLLIVNDDWCISTHIDILRNISPVWDFAIAGEISQTGHPPDKLYINDKKYNVNIIVEFISEGYGILYKKSLFKEPLTLYEYAILYELADYHGCPKLLSKYLNNISKIISSQFIIPDIHIIGAINLIKLSYLDYKNEIKIIIDENKPKIYNLINKVGLSSITDINILNCVHKVMYEYSIEINKGLEFDKKNIYEVLIKKITDIEHPTCPEYNLSVVTKTTNSVKKTVLDILELDKINNCINNTFRPPTFAFGHTSKSK